MITWCVAHTQPLKELVTQQHLLDQGYEAYMPRFKKTVRYARKVEEKLVPLFPRYIFVGMALDVAGWRILLIFMGREMEMTLPTYAVEAA